MITEPGAATGVSFGRLAVVAAAVVVVLVGMSLGGSVVTLVVFSAIISLLLAPLRRIAAIGLADAFADSRPIARLLVEKVPDAG